MESTVQFLVIFMKDSLFAWIGTAEHSIQNLALSLLMHGPPNSLPASSELLGGHESEKSEIAVRIAAHIVKRREGGACFVSYNLLNDPAVAVWAEKVLVGKIVENDKKQAQATN